MGWMISHTKLDEEQREFIDYQSKENGHKWIKGHAGSGKSVLLVHALRERMIENPRLRVGIVLFTHSLIDMFKTGMKEVDIEVDKIPVMTFRHFMDKDERSYDLLLIDEIQDLNLTVLNKIKSKANEVIVAGDMLQSIYDNVPNYWDEPTLSPSDINSTLSPREIELSTIYRLTRSIKEMVQNIFPSYLEAKLDGTKKDVRPRFFNFSSNKDEASFIWEEAQKGPSVNQSSAILLYRQEAIVELVNLILEIEGCQRWHLEENRWGRVDFGSLNRHLMKNDISLEYIGNSYGSLENTEKRKKVVIMTYHSAKGLDFDNVFLPQLQWDKGSDTVLMVGITRSKNNLYLTYVGRYRSDQIQGFARHISDTPASRSSSKSTYNEDDIIF